MADAIEGFDEVRMTFRGTTRPVLVARGDGPPVLLLHEIFGVTGTVAEFARTIRDAGFKVYVPALFGSTKPKSGAAGKALGMAQFACVAHQFRTLAAEEPGPWADWLRDLAARACADTGARGAGVIGLCLTGDFALTMAMDARILAPVMGQPSLPFFRGDALHVAPEALAAVKRRVAEDGLEVRAYRYSTDTLCPAARFERLRAELGEGFRDVTIEVDEKLHSVFTEHLRDRNGALRHDKTAEVIGFMRDRLG